MRKPLKWFMISSTLVLALVLAAWASLLFMISHNHQHCIKAAGLALRAYAEAHGGSYPTSEHGYAEALLEVVRSGYLSPSPNDLKLLTAPGGSTEPFSEALKNQTPVKEADASRVYVQGLTLTNSSPGDLLVLFDKNSNHGDHSGNYPFGLFKPKVREATSMAGNLIVIPEAQWPEVVSKNIRYLKERGFSNKEISAFYPLPPGN
jgi:hypothetical protein